MGEDDEGHGEDHACEESRSYLERGSLLDLICVDDTSVGDQLFTPSDLVVLAGIGPESDESHLLGAPRAVIRDDEAGAVLALLPEVGRLHRCVRLALDWNLVDLGHLTSFDVVWHVEPQHFPSLIGALWDGRRCHEHLQ